MITSIHIDILADAMVLFLARLLLDQCTGSTLCRDAVDATRWDVLRFSAG